MPNPTVGTDTASAQVRVAVVSSQTVLVALGATRRLRAGTNLSDPWDWVLVVDCGGGVTVVVVSVGWGSAARRAWSTRPMTRWDRAGPAPRVAG
jgi:hypothetical protein